MEAGKSAREVARRTAAASEVLQRKADYAARKSANFALGADGEEEVAAAIDGLTGLGWVVLPDRLTPAGGNLDFLLVGPPGVVVVDAKNWSYRLEVRDDRIFTGRYNRSKELDHLLEQMHLVEGALVSFEVPVVVRGILALAGDLNREHPQETVRGVRVMGALSVQPSLKRAKAVLTAEQIETIVDHLQQRFPLASASGPDAGAPQSTQVSVNPSDLFERAHRFLYLRTWRKSGHHRLYLRSSAGADLGWKDVNSLQIELSCEGDDAKLARAVLEFATPVGVSLPSGALPKIPIDLPGGRMIGWVTKVRMAVCIGQEWKKGGGHRLYGTLVDPQSGTFPLGYADLKTGRLVPSVEGDLSRDLGPAEKYLKLIADRQPEN